MTPELAAAVLAGGYWLLPPAPGAELALVCTGAVVPEALEALAAVREDIPGAGLLHRDLRRPPARGLASRRGRAGTRRGSCWRRWPRTPRWSPCSTATRRRSPGWARCRPARLGAGRRPVRPVGRPARPLPRPRARRRRHPGRLRRGLPGALGIRVRARSSAAHVIPARLAPSEQLLAFGRKPHRAQ